MRQLNTQSFAQSITLILASLGLLVGCGASSSTGGPPIPMPGQNAANAYRGAPAMVMDQVQVTSGVAYAEEDSGGAFFDDVYEDVDGMDDYNVEAKIADVRVAQAQPPSAPPEPEDAGGGGAGGSGDAGDSGTGADGDIAEAIGAAGVDSDGVAPPTQRVIIYTADLTVYVLEIDIAIEAATERAQELGGWLQASTSTSITLRIPAEHFHEYIEVIEATGRVVDKNVNGQDVTEEFYDLQIRLRNALDLRDRYRELLAKATTVEDTLQIERELARITAEIESMKGRIRFLEQHARNSTVTLYFVEDPNQLPKAQRVQLPFHWLSGYSIDAAYSRY